MESKSPKERLLIVLRRGNADKVEALIKQFPGKSFLFTYFLYTMPKNQRGSREWTSLS